MNRDGAGYQSATYDVTKPLRVEGYNNTFRERANMNQVTYYHIPKCGSSSMRKMLGQIGGTRILWRQSWFDGYTAPSSLAVDREIECGFTFVRHPIHRFISAYYTLNKMLQFDSKRMAAAEFKAMRESLKHWDMADRCDSNLSCFDKLYVFVDQLVDDSWRWINNYEDVLSLRVMEHVGSISGHFMAGYDGWNIDYVGKVEQFGKHWDLLSRETPKCSSGYLEKYWEETEGSLPSSKRRLKVNGDGAVHGMNQYGQKGHRALNRSLPDAYYALATNRASYDKLVEYYYQDFVCFDYDMSFESFLDYIRLHDPSFDAIARRFVRTKT